MRNRTLWSLIVLVAFIVIGLAEQSRHAHTSLDWTKQAIGRGTTNQRLLCLTFDDGPNPNTTPDLLRILRKHNAKATFFLIGRRVKLYPDIARQIADEGHDIGNHSMTHPNLTQLESVQVFKEWSDCSLAIKDAVGFLPRYCRPPGGQANRNVLQLAGDLRMRAVAWTFNSEDFKSDSWTAVRDAVLKKVENGGIILLHEKVFHTTTALDEILTVLEEKQFKMVSLTEMEAYDDEQDDRALLPPN